MQDFENGDCLSFFWNRKVKLLDTYEDCGGCYDNVITGPKIDQCVYALVFCLIKNTLWNTVSFSCKGFSFVSEFMFSSSLKNSWFSHAHAHTDMHAVGIN